MIAIKLDSVSKTYPGEKNAAVSNLSLKVAAGSIVTLLGPSGCGKTTTLRLIAGFERPDSGKITLAKKIVSDNHNWIPPENRDIGMVFQDYALFPHLNVLQNIGFGYKGKDKTGRVKEVTELVNLIGYENRYPHELSGGQQQRVALARALARKPVVILLDEPFSNLDASLREHIRIEVKRIIKKAGATAVFVSHDQKDALAISDKIVVLKDGVVQQQGTPREIYQFPENKFVASFVGQSNIMKGIIGIDGRSVDTSMGSIPCYHTHGFCKGEKVCISVRPDSFEMDKEGNFAGTIKHTYYTGQSVDAIVELTLGNGTKKEILVHVHPEEEVKSGDLARFKVLPHFVAVIKDNAK